METELSKWVVLAVKLLIEKFPHVPIVIACESTPIFFAQNISAIIAKDPSTFKDVHMIYKGFDNFGDSVGIFKQKQTSYIMESIAALTVQSLISTSNSVICCTNKLPYRGESTEEIVLETFRRQMLSVMIDKKGKVSGDRRTLRDDMNDAFMLACYGGVLCKTTDGGMKRVYDLQPTVFCNYSTNKMLDGQNIHDLQNSADKEFQFFEYFRRMNDVGDEEFNSYYKEYESEFLKRNHKEEEPHKKINGKRKDLDSNDDKENKEGGGENEDIKNEDDEDRSESGYSNLNHKSNHKLKHLKKKVKV